MGAFCSPSSVFVLKERVQLTSGWQTQERQLFLFSDTLIIAKSKSSSSLKLKKQVRLSEVWVSSGLSEVSDKKLSTDHSFVIGWPTTNYIVTFSSSETKQKWLSALCWHMNEVKKEEYPRKVSISVLYLDPGEFTSSVTVSVSNTDPADHVIKLVSQQLGIPGRSGDYHLWVMSGKDEPPYPLIGHEFPYSITLNCLRGSLELPRGSNNNLFLDQGSETVPLQQLPRDRQCQFILKLRPQVPLQLRRAQKHSRRKKSLIDWALRRSGSTPLSSPASHSPPTPRKLFGLSLTSVCHNGNLPKPIMDMLLLLYEEGPNTRGIFRRSANAKTCKELKEKLNCGDEVRMDGESVLVAAAVITDFLRNIPDSILSSDMYGLWMDATDMEQHEYKIEAIKGLVEQLPGTHSILLQHLFAVLRHIEENSEENQMTAFNLALCIAPNMLWLPNPGDPEEESRSTRKVAQLVQFLIENYELIFGPDTESLFQKSEKERSASTEDLAGIHPIHRQDSSDELEFAASDQEKSDLHPLNDGDGIFDDSLLIEEREDWDLFSEIAACYQSKSRVNHLESSSTDPFNCMDSACSLSPSRDRCSSEPSVCLISRLPAQDHEPVARQSSCDATIMHNHIDYINQLKQLRLENQKLLDEGPDPNVNMTRHTFVRSPQSSMRMKRLSPQKMSPSNRSSISSLSSTTSPSASSLSSLDSAFSYCSESSVFSPNDVPSMPFMFGTSARLHALSPEISKKKLKEWHVPLSTLFAGNSFDLDSSEEQDENKGSSSVRSRAVDGEATREDTVHRNTHNKKREGKEQDGFDYSGQAKGFRSTVLEPTCEANTAPGNGQGIRRETSVKHIEIRRPESSNDESLKRTKITFYMSSHVIPAKNLEDQKTNPDNPECPTVKLNIPQTVFYGQNTPLILHSVSRRQHADMARPEWHSQLKHVLRRSPAKETLGDHTKATRDSSMAAVDNEGVKRQHGLQGPYTEEASKESTLNKSHSKTIASFSHTIRIILPASVRNTVKEYFKHSEPKPSSAPHVEAVEKELIRSRMERCNLQGTDTGRGAKDQGSFMEESFV
ncbi:rho GTPase-activating protein 20-like isoform X2 [Ascaphus truei]